MSVADSWSVCKTVISKVMNLLIRELAKPTSVLSVAGFIRSSSTSYCAVLHFCIVALYM